MTASFQFEKYDVGEVQTCSDAFKKAVDEMRKAEREGLVIETADWTHFVLNWFSATARKGLVVDAKRARAWGFGRPPRTRALIKELTGEDRDTRGESLFDLAHSDYPPYEEGWGTAAYWERALAEPRQLFLVLESEWGKENSPGAIFAMVLEDATKLLHVDARVKVVIFGSHSNDHRDQILRCGAQMAKIDRAKAAWLWFDVPWEPQREALYGTFRSQ